MNLRPMLVTSAPLRPDSTKYSYEVKWDGFRALITATPETVTITSRNGHDMTARYPELQALTEHVTHQVLLDGEIVVLDDAGKPDFAALWFSNRGSATHGRVCFMAFDLLAQDHEPLIDEPYSTRRERLEALDFDGPHWCTPPSYVHDGASLFEATRAMGLEGVVCKRLDSRYRPGVRTKAWTKTKHFQKRNFALLGWLPPEEWHEGRGCVALGLRTTEGIALAGVVESGYGRELVEQLPQLTRHELRFLSEPGSLWQDPEPALIGEVKYLEWSRAGGLRHARLISFGDHDGRQSGTRNREARIP